MKQEFTTPIEDRTNLDFDNDRQLQELIGTDCLRPICAIIAWTADIQMADWGIQGIEPTVTKVTFEFEDERTGIEYTMEIVESEESEFNICRIFPSGDVARTLNTSDGWEFWPNSIAWERPNAPGSFYPGNIAIDYHNQRITIE